MGLASKLAAANANAGAAPASGAPPQPAQRPAGYPGQSQYQAYPGQSAQQAPPNYGAPQQQYGAPPQQQSYGTPQQQQSYGAPQQQQYATPGGAPSQQSAGQASGFKQSLLATIQERSLHRFYPQNSPAIDAIANRAPPQVEQFCAKWKVPRELGSDIVKLALYDIVLYIDDSGSMQFEEGGERIQDLQLILQRVAYAATLFDDDGISIRFMNSVLPPQMADGIRNDQQIENIMRSVQFKGLTPMGTELKKKVVDPFVINKAKSSQLSKPVLIIVVTDGQPAGEPANAVFETVKYANSELKRTSYGPGAIAFQFAQVGNDLKAREFLGKLDNDPVVGDLVDCTSNYENESAEMAQANPPVDLTPDLWLVKLLLGAIDASYDTKDETTSRPPASYPPQQMGGYGAPPGNYGQQGGYSRPPPPPPQGYGGQGQGQYGGYQQQGYGQQQQGGYGGYSAPPAPPRY